MRTAVRRSERSALPVFSFGSRDPAIAVVICSARATAAVTSPDVVLVADRVAASSVEAGSAIIAIAESEVAAALSPGCELVVFTFGISADVGTACLAA